VWTSAGYPEDVPLPADLEKAAYAKGYEAGAKEAIKAPLEIYGVFPASDYDDDGEFYSCEPPIVVFDTLESADAYLSLLEKQNAITRTLANQFLGLEKKYVVEAIEVRRDTLRDD